MQKWEEEKEQPPSFYEKIDEGDIIVAGENFGCGSSREQAPLVIKHSGISCVVSESFSRIFYRNAINMGLPLVELPDADFKLESGEFIKVNIPQGSIIKENGVEYSFTPFYDEILEIIKSGGIINYYLKKKMKKMALYKNFKELITFM